MSAQSIVTTPSARAIRYWLAGALQLPIVLVVVAGFVALWWVDTLPQRIDEQQTIVIGPTRFAPDSDGAVRIVVQDLAAGRPIAGARVRVSLKPTQGRAITLFEGETDASGSLPVSFHVPADAPAEATLVVETASQAGSDRVERPVTIQREYRLLLATDKPLYQPGQTIHMRALALSAFDLVPARGETINFLVEDARGNKVFRRSVVASDYGIAAADFTLADMVNQGDYRISDNLAHIGFEVKRLKSPLKGFQPGVHRRGRCNGDRAGGHTAQSARLGAVSTASLVAAEGRESLEDALFT